MLCQLSGALADEIGRLPQNRPLVESLIAALIMRVVHCLESPQPKRDPNVARRRLWRVLGHIEANLGRKLTIAELADAAGLSPPHFSRCLKRAMGTGPQRYVLRRRVERAGLLRLERVWAGTATPRETAAELRDNLIRSNELPHLPRALGGAG